MKKTFLTDRIICGCKVFSCTSIANLLDAHFIGIANPLMIISHGLLFLIRIIFVKFLNNKKRIDIHLLFFILSILLAEF